MRLPPKGPGGALGPPLGTRSSVLTPAGEPQLGVDPRRGAAARCCPPPGSRSLVVTPAGEPQLGGDPRWGAAARCCPPLGSRSLVVTPAGGLPGFVGEVAIQGGAADTQVLGDVLGGMAVVLHPPRRGDVVLARDFPSPPKFGAVGQRHRSFEGGALLHQLALVFGERPQHPDHHAASSGR